MKETHENIRKLLKVKDYSPHCLDAILLGRRQIEMIFCVLLILTDIEKWINAWEKDSWRSIYYHYLVEKNIWNKENESLKNTLDKRSKILKISDKEKEAINFEFENPNKSLPNELKNFKIKRFPLPAKIKNELIKEKEDNSVKEILNIFYNEYRMLSNLTHPSSNSIGFKRVLRRKIYLNNKIKLEKFFQNVIVVNSYFPSWISLIIVMSEFCNLNKNHVESRIKIDENWDYIKKYHHLAQKIWNLRYKDIFGIIN